MGKITKELAQKILEKHNPVGRADRIAQYLASYMTYIEANENIEKNGAIVAHPRTGMPIENPYLKVRSVAMSDLRKLQNIKGISELWEETKKRSNNDEGQKAETDEIAPAPGRKKKNAPAR